jgi:hypothetical protein
MRLSVGWQHAEHLLMFYLRQRKTQQMICSNSLGFKNANSILLASRYWHSFLPIRLVSLSKIFGTKLQEVIRGRRKMHNEEVNDLSTSLNIFFTMAQQIKWARDSSYSRLHDHTQLDTPHWVGLLWTSDQPDADTSTWQHTTHKRDRHLCSRRDSNPQSQQDSGRRPTS